MNDKSDQSTNAPRFVLDVALLPSLVEPESLRGQTVVVVDVLRATTTITNSLFNGCAQVLPQPSIESARAAHEAFAGESLLGGERGGQIVDGFHNGNSPIEYTEKLIKGKTLILATTNGTVAMERCREAKRVLIGAMVNLAAVAKAIEDDPMVTVVCSGTDRFITSEDVVFAGALMQRLIENRKADGKPVGQLTDNATIALDHWQAKGRAIEKGGSLADHFRNAKGGINLVRIGHDPDIVFASQIDAVPVVPELDLESWSIRLTDQTGKQK
ncbi:MAG: 2-phosphosulfolactate phosphatase [Mariniblastus sp.]